MRLYKRIKRSTRQYIIVSLICMIVIGSAAVFTSSIVTGQVKQEYRSLLRKAYQEQEANQRIVYVAVADINAGDMIREELVEEKTVYSSQPQETYITQTEIGKTALIDIPVGTQIINSMLIEHRVADELREAQYRVITVNSNIVNNDTVDVRLRYPNGESYVVLSKKIIKGYSAETATCYFWNNETELLRMSAAIVDASLYPGSELITTRYIEPNLQKASEITYTPSLQVLSLIENDPNIVDRCSQEINKTIRKSLENRLAQSMEADVTAPDWEVSDDEFLSGEGALEKQKDEEASEEAVTVTPFPDNLGSEEMDTENVELGAVQTERYFYFAKEGEIEYGE